MSIKPIRRTQEERSASAKEKLSRAASELIEEGGFANFRVAAVPPLAGVSQGGLLHHYPTKDDLTFAAVEHAVSIAQEVSERNLARCKQSSADVLQSMIQDFCDYYFSPSFDVAMDIVKGASANRALRSRIAKTHRAFRLSVEEEWRGLLVAVGCTQEDASEILDLSSSLVRGFAIRAMIQPQKSRADSLIQRWQALIRNEYSIP